VLVLERRLGAVLLGDLSSASLGFLNVTTFHPFPAARAAASVAAACAAAVPAVPADSTAVVAIM
jgi:hypothetical protein